MKLATAIKVIADTKAEMEGLKAEALDDANGKEYHELTGMVEAYADILELLKKVE